MNLNWLQSILYGFLSGLTDILPVSSQAHKVLLLKLFGIQVGMEFIHLWIHLGIFAALYFCCRSQIVRINRARALARVPKRRRKRPLDTRTLMDWSMLKTMLIPVILGLLLYRRTVSLGENLMLLALFLFLNGLILYIPQFLPGSNRDSRNLSRVEGLLMGLGGAASMLPGISAVGSAASIGCVCGVERSYSLNMALLMNLVLTLGLVVQDAFLLLDAGIGTFSFLILLRYLLTAITAFGGTVLGVKVMRYLAGLHGFDLFAFYCFGLSLFTFILNLLA